VQATIHGQPNHIDSPLHAAAEPAMQTGGESIQSKTILRLEPHNPPVRRLPPIDYSELP
jgi:hypothetical protein